MPTRTPINRLFRLAAIAVTVVAVIAIPSPAPVRAAVPLDLVVGGFASPLYVTNAGDARLFVVEQRGLIRIIHPNESVTTFLNLSGLVSQSGNERGLLGLAFHTNYASNGLFYVNYTRQSDGDIVVAEYERSANPNAADPGSARIVLTIEHSSETNHNGGWMGFNGGANMFIAVGDGGGSPGNRSQDISKLVGKILRINPLDPDGNGPRDYSIPPSNPYVGRSGKDAIWSLGLRNPWRCSHDSETGKMWCPDVGQNNWEEINRQKTGKQVNYGWPLLEGRHRYPSGSVCTSNCKTLPIAEYAHDVAGTDDNCSVTGGYVSRRAGAALYGDYVFGDFCSGRVWVIPAGFASGSSLPAPAADTDHVISSFGKGADGRLYLVDYGGGIYRLTDS